MRFDRTTALATGGVLILAGAGSWLLPFEFGEPDGVLGRPNNSPNQFTVNGVIRDFSADHPDFADGTGGFTGHHAGNVATYLDDNGRPVFAGFQLGPVEEFNIVNGTVVPTVAYTPMITILGSAIVMGNYDSPVTVKVHLGTQELSPFGSFSQALAGNVNDSANPRSYVHNSTLNPNTPIWIDARSWTKTQQGVSGLSESHWEPHLMFSSQGNTQQVKVLRDGDPAPSILGFGGQTSVAEYVSAFIDSTNHIDLDANQAIFLFELGTTDMSSSAADFQDVVVLVTLGQSTGYLDTLDETGQTIPGSLAAYGYKVSQQWRDANGNAIPPHLYNAETDSAGAPGSSSSGRISSGDTFGQWFSDVLGTNLSAQHSIVLTKSAGGVWEYITDEFHPIDGELMGNEGDEHNSNFTFSFQATFIHHAGEQRFIEFDGADDVWVFIDGRLAMDRGGILPGTRQYVDVDRLGLTDGQPHTLTFFHAQRQDDVSSFYLRTNLDLQSSNRMSTVTAGYD